MLYTLITLHSRSSKQVICQETRDSQWSEQPWSSSIFSAAAAKVSMHWEGFVGTGMARIGPFESRYTCTHAPSIEDWKSTQHEWLSPFNFQCFNVAALQVQVKASWNWVPTWPNWRIIYDFFSLVLTVSPPNVSVLKLTDSRLKRIQLPKRQPWPSKISL